MMTRMTCDKPVDKLKEGIVAVVKKMTAKMVFPCSKFLMKEEDVNQGYVQLAFVQLGWISADSQHKLLRAKHWRAVAQEIVRRCGDRRARALSMFKKTCKGMDYDLVVFRRAMSKLTVALSL